MQASQPRLAHVAIGLVMWVLGLSVFSDYFPYLWRIWTQDALRSIGLLIAVTAVVLGWRQGSSVRWTGGSWWGFALVVAGLALGCAAHWVTVIPQAAGGALSFNAFPVGALIALYSAGVVVLFGGAAAWRRLWFPVLLLIFLNPVPLWFSRTVDVPLQAAAAQTARGFAHLVHVPFEGDALKLMFGPKLGIFIAPGCDGLRGAVTLGYLALVGGYLVGLPRWKWLSYVMGAVAVAYVFNLLRLCCVVLYYRVAQSWPASGAYGTEVDYVIGGALFILAGTYLYRAPRWLKGTV